MPEQNGDNLIVCPMCGKVTTIEYYYSEHVYGHGEVKFSQPEFDLSTEDFSPHFYEGEQWEIEESIEDDSDDFETSDLHCPLCSNILTFEQIAEGRKQHLISIRDLTAPRNGEI